LHPSGKKLETTPHYSFLFFIGAQIILIVLQWEVVTVKYR